MTIRRSSLALLSLVAALPAAIGACSSDPSATTTAPEHAGQDEAEIASPGIERIIPIRFLFLDDDANRCPVQATADQIHSLVREVNSTWSGAGIQFAVSRFDRYNAPTFRDLQQWGSPLDWSSVWRELSPIDPAAITPSAFTGAKFDEFWLTKITERLPKSTIHVFLTCRDQWLTDGAVTNTSHASYPGDTGGESNRFHLVTSQLGAPTLGVNRHWTNPLSHELGHFFGLPHTFEEDARNNAAWDAVYGVNPGGSPRFFSSPADLASFTGTRKLKDGLRPNPASPGTNIQNCTHDTSCNFTCVFEGRTYTTTANPNEVAGIGMNYGGGALGTNVMSYYGSGASCLYGLTRSQVQRVREVLRGTAGDRHLLGRGARYFPRTSTSTIDFDNDGQRDLAYFRPAEKACFVKQSRGGATVKISLPNYDAALGDVPMPGDYDGDGRTDCAIYRPGTTSSPSYWFWTKSSDWNRVETSMFGQGGDIPIADVRLPASPGWGRFAIYRPESGQVWWQTDASNARWVSFGGTLGDEIVAADYDRDGDTDLALWRPRMSPTSSAQSYFGISYSGNNFASQHWTPFGLETDVPVGAVQHDLNPALDFAVWRPSSGTWYYLMNPRRDGNDGNREQGWGLTGDIPMGGFDFDGDGIHDEAIYRPSAPVSSIWVLKSKGGYLARNLGWPGDLPFFAPSRNGDTMPEFWLFRPNGYPTANYFEALSSGGDYPSYSATVFGATTDIHF